MVEPVSAFVRSRSAFATLANPTPVASDIDVSAPINADFDTLRLRKGAFPDMMLIILIFSFLKRSFEKVGAGYCRTRSAVM